jgi:hypothetical protein
MASGNQIAALEAEALRFQAEQEFNQFQRALLPPGYGGSGPGVNAIGQAAASATIAGTGSVVATAT